MNTATAAAVGTSLEVLAPYLPYKIEVENIRQNGFTKQGTRHLLVGLDCTDDFPIKAGSMCYKPEGVLPVLRDFSQLTVPLPDGTPLVDKLAEILFGDALEPNCELSAGFDWFGNYVATANGALLFSISLYWHIRCGNDLPAGFEAYDYLRSQHFAVGLEGHQFIKAAPSTPTREADNNPIL